ncbi:MAG: CBS domain-containing protein [Halodesulfurarchaeum sp.]
MDDIFVGRLMSSPVRTIDPETPVDEAARMMAEEGIGSVAVVDDLDHLDGILTSTDFVKAVASGESMADTPASAFMTEDVITTTANTPIRDVADLMTEHGFHHVPVVEDEHVIGMITTTDLTVYLSHLEKPSPA